MPIMKTGEINESLKYIIVSFSHIFLLLIYLQLKKVRFTVLDLRYYSEVPSFVH